MNAQLQKALAFAFIPLILIASGLIAHQRIQKKDWKPKDIFFIFVTCHVLCFALVIAASWDSFVFNPVSLFLWILGIAYYFFILGILQELRSRGRFRYRASLWTVRRGAVWLVCFLSTFGLMLIVAGWLKSSQ